MDITIDTWISVHEETERKTEHCLPCRSTAVSIDTAAQAEGVNSKTAFCISAQQFTSLSSTPAPSEKPRREPTPGFCCWFWGSDLDQRTELGHVSRGCSLQIIQLLGPRCTPSHPLPSQTQPPLPGKLELQVTLMCCGCDRSP